MRALSLTVAICLAFALVTSAAPAIPGPGHVETAEERRCTNDCLTEQEDCLLNSIRMAGCFDAYDECHRSCVPEDQEEVAPPTTPATPNPVQAPAPNQDGNPTEPNKSNNQKHKDVTHETDNPIPAPAPGTEVHQDSGPTQEDIENLPEYEEDEDYIPAPPGGEDDEEFEDDVSDY